MYAFSKAVRKPKALTDRHRETVRLALEELRFFVSFSVHAKQHRLDAKLDVARKNAVLPDGIERREERRLIKERTQITFGRGLRYAAEANIAMDPFLGDGAAVSEGGFEWEDALFGGRFQLLYGDDEDIKINKIRQAGTVLSDLVDIPVLWDWPDRMITVNYHKHGLGLWRSNNWEKRMREQDVAWLIPVADIASYFMQAFCNGIDARNPTALRLPKSVGRLFKADENGEPLPSGVSPKDKKRHVPQGYKAPAGDIRLKGN